MLVDLRGQLGRHRQQARPTRRDNLLPERRGGLRVDQIASEREDADLFCLRLRPREPRPLIGERERAIPGHGAEVFDIAVDRGDERIFSARGPRDHPLFCELIHAPLGEIQELREAGEGDFWAAI